MLLLHCWRSPRSTVAALGTIRLWLAGQLAYLLWDRMLLGSALEVDMDLQQEYDELCRTAADRPRNKVSCIRCGAEHEFLDDGDTHEVECDCGNRLIVRVPFYQPTLFKPVTD